MRKMFLSFIQQGGGRLSARPDQNDLNNYEKNEVRKVTNLHEAESESFCNNHKIPFRKFLDWFVPQFSSTPLLMRFDAIYPAAKS